MTNPGPEDLPVLSSPDNPVEKPTLGDGDVENPELNSLSTTDVSKSKGSNHKGRNPHKQTCWFFINHNYCRYGRNCRFSHAKPHSPGFSSSRISESEVAKVSNSKTGSRARNLKQNMNSKESSSNVNDHETKIQNQVEENCDDTRRQRSETAHFDRHRNRYDNGIPRNSFNTYTHVGDKYPNRPNVQMARQSSGIMRQKNLYFYSSSRKAPDSTRNKTQASNQCRYFLKGFCRLGDSCKFLHQTDQKQDTVEENNGKPAEESVAPVNKESAAKAPNEVQPQNRCNISGMNRFVKLQDADQNDIQRLRDIEIQQLKKRFPTHEVIESAPEEILHVTFSPSDPDWSFAVNSVPLEITFSKDYPREACTIKVLEEDNLMPSILVWHLNKTINEWIKEKHQSAVDAGKVELLFRPFLKWFDRNLAELFLIGLRKVKQDVLAKEAGIEFVPYEELPGALPEASAATRAKETTDHENQDDSLSTSQKSDDTDLPEKAGLSAESESVRDVHHTDNDSGTIKKKALSILSEVNTDSPLTSAEKENFSPDAARAKFSSHKEREYPFRANNDFSIPKLGTEVKLLGLELRESAAAMVCTKIAITLQCSRCKTRHEINTPPKRNNTLNCIKCHQSMQIVFHHAMLHQFSAVLGYLHLTECQAVDIPLMECNFSVDCLNCSKQFNVNGIHYGQQRVTWCSYCNKKLSIYVQSVKFHQLQPASNIASPGHKLTTATKNEKKSIKDPAIQEGQPLPDYGTCKHYKKSHRWLRFPCCGKAYPCDVCHDEKETDHEIKYANRMICGFCATEQPYAGMKPCINCSSNMTKKAGSHWEGGKGCRDKITMNREDRQKYAGMSKTISRKSQNQTPSKK